MLYLLDANVLIDANRDYYPITRIPEFWDWLEHQGTQDNLKLPLEMFEEIKEGSDDPSLWSKEIAVRNAILLNEEAHVATVQRVLHEGYGPDLSDDEIEQVGRDPFLIAYALAAQGDRCVVTTERSKPRRTRARRHVPDVCSSLHVPCIDTFEFVRALDFSTQWRSQYNPHK